LYESLDYGIIILIRSLFKNQGTQKIMKSKILQDDNKDMIRLYKRMKPEERLMAFFNHSRLVNEIYQAGVKARLNSSRN